MHPGQDTFLWFNGVAFITDNRQVPPGWGRTAAQAWPAKSGEIGRWPPKTENENQIVVE